MEHKNDKLKQQMPNFERPEKIQDKIHNNAAGRKKVL
jgi:hypothetical protein